MMHAILYNIELKDGDLQSVVVAIEFLDTRAGIDVELSQHWFGWCTFTKYDCANTSISC